MTLDPARLLSDARDRFVGRQTTFPRFVVELERAVYAAEEADEPYAAALRGTWGQIEIINALAEQRPLDAVEAFEVGGFVTEMQTIIAAGRPRGAANDA